VNDQFLQDFEVKLDKVLDVLKQDLATIRTGRANVQMVAHVVLSVYEGTQKLELGELGTVTTQDAQTIVFVPFDHSIIKEVEKGLRKANLSFSIIPEEDKIRLKVAQMSRERRVEYIELAKKKVEGAKILGRQVRKEAMQNIKRKVEREEIGEDEKFRLEKKIQGAVDRVMEKIQEIGEKKEEEIRQL
jgi:ribosome recycling factor